MQYRCARATQQVRRPSRSRYVQLASFVTTRDATLKYYGALLIICSNIVSHYISSLAPFG